MDLCADLGIEISRAMNTGLFLGLNGESREEEAEGLFGAPERTTVKKGVRTASYPDFDLLFENHCLHQITVKVTDEKQSASLRCLMEKNPSETADQVPPFFRCFRLLPTENACCEVLVTTAYAEPSAILSVALVFAKRPVERLEMEIPAALYDRLVVLSNSTRLTVNELCVSMLEQGTAQKEHEKQ